MSAIRSFLDQLLPDPKVMADIRAIIQSNGDELIELGDRNVSIPVGSDLEILSKACIDRRRKYGFGDIIVTVAIGGIQEVRLGHPVAKICFAVVYYDLHCEFISIDFLERPF